MRIRPLVVASLVVFGLVAVSAQERVAPYKPGAGITLPRVIKEVKPVYPEAVKEERVQGYVQLRTVVEADGTVGEVEVTKALEPRLDEEAVKAARQWLFEPGKKDGKPVPVEITLEMTFTLK